MENEGNRYGSHRIRLGRPAGLWEDGLPLGNGRLGAMIMGKPDWETIVINEETLWYGKDRNRKNPDTLRYLPEIRKLLTEGEVEKAAFLARMAMTSTPKYHNPYQLAGEMRLNFSGCGGEVTEYERSLDIDSAVAQVSYRIGETRFLREHFVSRKYQVFVARLTADKPGALTVSVNMSRRPYEENTGKLDGCTVCNYGQCGEGGVSYFTGIRMEAVNGCVGTIGDYVYASEADEVLIYLACGTDYADPEYRDHVLKRLTAAQKTGYQAIKEEHGKEYAQLYGRMGLRLGPSGPPEGKEGDQTGCSGYRYTDEKLESIRRGEKRWRNELTEDLFAYARYLLISSSTDCLLPANLQGIWNGDYEPAWQSEYTININEEMNYWFAEKCNLSECQKPVLEQVKRMAVRGRKTARELYGCSGFVAHHNTNLWDNTDPEGIFDSSPYWPMGGAWLCLHLYDHYLYTQDEEFLKKEALPIMREAIRFFEDYLYETEDGMLVTGPSLSPENTFLTSDGQRGALCMGPAMDMEILRQLILDYLEGCAAVNEEADGNEKLKQLLSRLPSIQMTEDGRIREWLQDYEEAEPGHRHFSPLFGLHPGTLITPETPELFRAAARTLQNRLDHGSGQTGWSRAWVSCFAARLKNGELVGESVDKLLQLSIKNNLLDIHPPFQIDGNFGIAEGICEALIQSQNGYIELLPALPPEWPDGSVYGMVLRGAVTADFEWKGGRLFRLVLKSRADRMAEVRYGGETRRVLLPAEKEVRVW